ncbi:hypothetical protein [Kamptonema formosum]|uniref:hypothetical protein n=1 Tax=Kamptonema formosum TaxID=331992 RepID=UPI0003481959|nr:hypothetical protein [Oscillatoria sp. PCC 10802]
MTNPKGGAPPFLAAGGDWLQVLRFRRFDLGRRAGAACFNPVAGIGAGQKYSSPAAC